MATWGNNASASSATRNIESEGRGIEIAVGEAGNITSGRAKLSDGVANAHDCKMEIYDSAGNHLGSSDVLENGVSTSLGYVDFTFSTQIPVDNETIRAYAWGDNLGSGLNLAYDGGSGRNFQGLATYPTAPDPDGSGADGRYYAVSVTVTPGGTVITTTTASITYTTFPATITTTTKSVDSVTGTVAPNEQVTVNCTGFVTVTSITLGGESLTVDAQNNGNPICTIPSSINLKWGQSYNLVVTDITGSEQLSTTLQARAGWEIVEWVGPAPDTGTTESFYEEAIEDFSITAGAGDQLQHTTAASMTVDGQWIPTVSPAGSRSGTYAVWDESASTRSSEAAWSIILNVGITTTTQAISYTTYPATIVNGTVITTNTRQVVYTTFPATISNENVITTNTRNITYTTYPATITNVQGIVTGTASIRYTTYPATITNKKAWTEIPRNTTTWTEI